MTKTIASATDTNKKYFLTIDDNGHAVQCSCPDRQHRSYKPCCKHMSAFEAEVQRAATFQALRNRFDSRLNGQEQSRRCYYEMSLGY